MKRYNPSEIEPKWQQTWTDTQLYKVTEDSSRPKYYMLTEFPYPSGDGLHAGHIREYTVGDVIARHKRMQGHNVLYPMGYDAFGLPTENYAIKHKIAPQVATATNVANFRRQFDQLGLSFDWSREVNTTDPDYYRWTQWLFLQFLKAGLAYQDEIAINWCPKEKTGLANEEVVNGKHERCGTPVEKKFLKQWLFRITDYADRLIDGLKTVDFPDKIANQQINWIGRSEGAEIDFAIKTQTEPTFYQFFEPGKIKPEHPFVERDGILAIVKHWNEDKYLGLRWKQVDWETFITGGIEAGQTPETAALAEIQQETGYINARLVKDLGRMHSQFFHVPKNQNRHGHFKMLYFELQDDKRVTVADEEQSIHEPVWLTRAEIADFKLPSSHRFMWEQLAGRPSDSVRVYTTRPDTLFGVTYLVLAPEHPLIERYIHQSSNAEEVSIYVKAAIGRAELERQEAKEKTGVELKGIKSVHPLTGEELPIWVADYVLAGYGTGAIMAVPAHDERDGEFAAQFDLPIIPVVEPVTGNPLPDEEYRRSIVALVRNPRTNEVLSINWGQQGGNIFIGGGIDEGEDVVETARREVLEETGYINLKLIGQSEKIHHHYIAHSKGGIKRGIDVWGVYFELENDDRDEQKLEADEEGKFTVEWLPSTKVEQLVNDELHKYVYEKFIGQKCYIGYGPLVNSGEFDGLQGDEAKAAIVSRLEQMGVGKTAKKYKLRDWVFSRQHYWGEPIPVIHCPKDGVVPVPDDQLPVTLPPVESYEPTDTGESPLAAMTDWVNVECPQCGGPAKRETDTMPNWAGSNWYYLRYMDPRNNQAFVGEKALDYWQHVDMYLGGMEHTTLHLLYSRFCHQFLYDQGLVPTPEPYAARRGQGIVLAADGRKMSKSIGNVINPSDIVAKYGADTMRLYILFMAPYDETTPWSDERLGGVNRFAYRVWTLVQQLAANTTQTGDPDGTFVTEVDRFVHKTLKKVHDDLHDMRFNTAIATMMELLNNLSTPAINTRIIEPRHADLATRTARTFVLMLAPFAPYIAEELWHELGSDDSVHTAAWPSYDPSLIKDDVVELAVQVNGKLRGTILAAVEASETEIVAAAKDNPNVAKFLTGTIAKTIVIPRRLVNFVVK